MESLMKFVVVLALFLTTYLNAQGIPICGQLKSIELNAGFYERKNITDRIGGHPSSTYSNVTFVDLTQLKVISGLDPHLLSTLATVLAGALKVCFGESSDSGIYYITSLEK